MDKIFHSELDAWSAVRSQNLFYHVGNFHSVDFISL